LTESAYRSKTSQYLDQFALPPDVLRDLFSEAIAEFRDAAAHQSALAHMQ
jgi:hypothetical protein